MVMHEKIPLTEINFGGLQIPNNAHREIGKIYFFLMQIKIYFRIVLMTL